MSKSSNTLFVAVIVHKTCSREAAPFVADKLAERGLTPANSRLVLSDMENELAIGEELMAEFGYVLAKPEPVQWQDFNTKPCKLEHYRQGKHKGQPYNAAAPAVTNNRKFERSQRAIVVYPKGEEYSALFEAWKALEPENVIACRIEYQPEDL